MMTSDDKVGGWVKKGQNHDDLILEWSLRISCEIVDYKVLNSKRLCHHCKQPEESQLCI